MRKFLKISAIVICSIIVLIIAALAYIDSPWGQDFVRGRAESYLRNKLKTDVHIGHLGYGVPKYVVLDDILLLDRKRDTLIQARKIKVDLDMFELLHKRVNIQQLLVDGLNTHIYRNAPDTTFNFSYILDAYASGAKTDTSKTSSSLSFNLDRVKLDNIRARYDDYTGGDRFALALDHMTLRMGTTDFGKMIFHVRELSISGLTSEYDEDTSYLPPKPKDTTISPVKIMADNVSLERVNFRYDNSLNKFLFAMQLGKLQLQLKEYNRTNNRVDIEKLVVSNSQGNLVIGKSTTPPAPIDTIVKIDTTEGWDVHASQVDLAGIDFKMDNENVARLKYGFDYQHLDIHGLGLNISDLVYYDTVAGNIHHFEVEDHSGLKVNELRTVFRYGSQGVVLNNLFLQTPNTTLQNRIEVHYPSVKAVTKDLAALQMNLNIVNSVIGLQDAALFVPYLHDQEFFRKYSNQHLALSAVVNGRLDDLNITSLNARGLGSTEVSVSGKLRGLPNANKLWYDLSIARFNATANDIYALTPKGTIPASIRLPDRFGAIGHIAGSTKDINANLVFASTDGVAHINGMIATSPGKGHERYDMDIRTVSLNLGHILRQDSLFGRITAMVTAKGHGLDVKTMNAVLKGTVSEAMVKGYNYHDIAFNAVVDGQKGTGSITSRDPNVMIAAEGQADFTGNYPAVVADIKIDSIDLHAMKLSATELKTRGIIHADIPVLNPDYPDGLVSWRQLVLLTGSKRYFLDSIYAQSRPSADSSQHIVLNLGAADAQISGHTPLTKVAGIVTAQINKYYSAEVTDTLKNAISRISKKKKPGPVRKKGVISPVAKATSIPASYDLSFVAHVHDKPILRSLLPELTSFDSMHADGSITPASLRLNADAPNVVYAGYTITNGHLRLAGDTALKYKLTMDEFTNSSGLDFYNADVHGALSNHVLTASAHVSDAARVERFAINTSMEVRGDSQVIRLDTSLTLNYQKWLVAGSNDIVLTPRGFYVRNFDISYNNQDIKANSEAQRPGAPLKVSVSNFVLADITSLMSATDTIPVNGVLNTELSLIPAANAMQASGTVQVNNLSLYKDTLGDIKGNFSTRNTNDLSADLRLTGYGNDVALSGVYYMNHTNNSPLEMRLDANALAVKTIEGLTLNQINSSSGFVRGNLTIKGTLSQPVINGTLNTDNVKTTVTQLNTAYRLPDAHIAVNNSVASFNRLEILDSTGNKAYVSGSIDVSAPTNPALNLRMNAENWRAVHSTAKQNQQIYGDLIVTANISVTGEATMPSVNGDVHVLKGTKVTLANPATNPEMQSTKGIVQFVNMRDTSWGKALMPQEAAQNKPAHKLKPGSEMNVNIVVDKTAEFSLIIDEASGDFIRVMGDGTLNTTVAADGSYYLTGTYQLHSGMYQMNYNFVRRRFLIQDGGVITFAGDPLKNTNLDVTAMYQANTPPYDLVTRQVPDQNQLVYYRQNLPFEVNLHMKGPLLLPTFNFDVVLPENKVYPLTADQIELVQARLNQVRQDTSELNKQVFAVLILGRFVSEDPFSASTGQGIGFAAVQSVSSFIGQELNKVANNLIKGVDLTVDLATTQDYTTGSMRQRTDLNLAASKRLLNDRLKLTVGNDFEVEGPQSNNNTQGNYLPSNLAADYNLTADGKYTVRVYRRDYNEGVLQGYVTEQGVNFIVSFDYNRFKYVFKKRPRQQPIAAANDSNVVTGPIK